jgi:hypothetical protein
MQARVIKGIVQVGWIKHAVERREIAVYTANRDDE